VLQERWVWRVAFASVTGFGPIVLPLGPLPDAAAYGSFALFTLDAVLLLALLDSCFEEPIAAAGGSRRGTRAAAT